MPQTAMNKKYKLHSHGKRYLELRKLLSFSHWDIEIQEDSSLFNGEMDKKVGNQLYLQKIFCSA
jgi:hypothetical protein